MLPIYSELEIIHSRGIQETICEKRGISHEFHMWKQDPLNSLESIDIFNLEILINKLAILIFFKDFFRRNK